MDDDGTRGNTTTFTTSPTRSLARPFKFNAGTTLIYMCTHTHTYIIHNVNTRNSNRHTHTHGHARRQNNSMEHMKSIIKQIHTQTPNRSAHIQCSQTTYNPHTIPSAYYSIQSSRDINKLYNSRRARAPRERSHSDTHTHAHTCLPNIWANVYISAGMCANIGERNGGLCTRSGYIDISPSTW